MDIAVGSKDKIPRMVITDGERVYLYRITPERVLEPEWTYRADTRREVFSVQLARAVERRHILRRGESLQPIRAISSTR